MVPIVSCSIIEIAERISSADSMPCNVEEKNSPIRTGKVKIVYPQAANKAWAK